MRVIHTYPLTDLLEHVVDGSGADCWCRPKEELCGEGLLIIHNSADRREVQERFDEWLESQ